MNMAMFHGQTQNPNARFVKRVRLQSRQDEDDVQEEIETFDDVAGNDGKEAFFFISLEDGGLDLSKVICHLR